MDARLLRACPAAMTTARSFATAACSLLQTTLRAPQPLRLHRPADRRGQATANRTKRALNVAPHASFVAAGGRGKAAAAAVAAAGATPIGTIRGGGDSTAAAAAAAAATLLYNPPASAPSVYQTPFKFLPKTDPRRRSNVTSLFAGAPTGAAAAPQPELAPELGHRRYDPPAARYHLTEADVAEMRRLRAADPIEWSVVRLARKFGCSPIFVMMVVRSSAEHRQRQQQQLAAVRQRWGPIRTKARADRQKRREMLYNGEL